MSIIVNNELGDQTLEEIKKGLGSNKSIGTFFLLKVEYLVLDLRGNNITKKGLMSLIQAFNDNTSLKKIYLGKI